MNNLLLIEKLNKYLNEDIIDFKERTFWIKFANNWLNSFEDYSGLNIPETKDLINYWTKILERLLTPEILEYLGGGKVKLKGLDLSGNKPIDNWSKIQNTQPFKNIIQTFKNDKLLNYKLGVFAAAYVVEMSEIPDRNSIIQGKWDGNINAGLNLAILGDGEDQEEIFGDIPNAVGNAVSNKLLGNNLENLLSAYTVDFIETKLPSDMRKGILDYCKKYKIPLYWDIDSKDNFGQKLKDLGFKGNFGSTLTPKGLGFANSDYLVVVGED